VEGLDLRDVLAFGGLALMALGFGLWVFWAGLVVLGAGLLYLGLFEVGVSDGDSR
jgi:hypothetical protein